MELKAPDTDLSQVRMIANFDPGSGTFIFLPNEPGPEDLHYVVDRYAEGIDALSYCVFEGGYTLVQNSELADTRPLWLGGYPFPECQGYRPFYERGEDPLRILADRCHHNGMLFLAAFRMNDRHGGPKGRFQEEHPEWQIREPGYEGEYWRSAIDYSFPEVRAWVCGLVREAAEGYDIDGIELDYMRWCHMFPPSVAAERHPMLTELMRDIRTVLDQVAAERGKTLILGARVPQRRIDCAALGYDIDTWVQAELVDYLSPSDFMHTDFNAPYDAFVDLCRGHRCRVYPSLHPPAGVGISGALLTPAQYRAAAHSMYGAGADGLSLYNYQYHWQQRTRLSYPGSPSEFADACALAGALRDPAAVAQGTRHYLFYPLWQDEPPSGVPGVEGVHRMLLLEREPSGRRGIFEFRLGQEPGADLSRAHLLFNAVNMTPEDRVEVDINGAAVADAELQRHYDPEGLQVEHRRPLGPYMSVQFFLDGLPLNQGINELGVRLVASDPAAADRIEIQEVEVVVDPVGAAP